MVDFFKMTRNLNQDILILDRLTEAVCLSVLHRDETRVLQFHYFFHYLRVLQMFAYSLKKNCRGNKYRIWSVWSRDGFFRIFTQAFLARAKGLLPCEANFLTLRDNHLP